MKKIAFVLACILTISICLAGCQETEFDTGEGTPVFSLDANEISAVTFQNGNTGEKTIVSNRDEITEIADYLNAFRYTETQSVRGGDGWSSRIIIDFNEGESISFYSLEAGKIIMDDTEYILTSSEEGKVFDLEYNDEEPNTAPTGETEDIEEDPSLVTNNEGQLISEFLDLDHTYSEDDVHIKFGLPQRTLSGFWGDVFVLEDGTEIIVYYDNDGLVDQVKVNLFDDTASSRRGGWSSVEFTPTSSNGNYICFQHKNKTDQNVRVYLYRTDESSRNYVTMMCVDANDVNSEVYYSPTAGFGTYHVVIEAYVSGGEISGDVVVNQCKNAPADPLE